MSFKSILSEYKIKKRKLNETNDFLINSGKKITNWVKKNINEIPVGDSELELEKVGRKHETDKITHHGYQRFYAKSIEMYKDLDGFAMLEIGIDEKKSLMTWLEYFPKLFIYGIEIKLSLEGERYKIFKCDQSKESELLNVYNQIDKPVCLIIDDGSHVPEHQLLTFDSYFSHLLQPGGTYIIEDIETSYWTSGQIYGYRTFYGYHDEKNLVHIFKDIADDINREFLLRKHKDSQDRLYNGILSKSTRENISSITFGANCIIIEKKSLNEKNNFDNRQYRFQHNL